MKYTTIAEIKKELKKLKDAEIALERKGDFNDSLRQTFNTFKDKLILQMDNLRKKEKGKTPFYTPKPYHSF